MIWLAWRQARASIGVAAALVAVFAVIVAIYGTHLMHLYDTTVVPCAARGDCTSALPNFGRAAHWTRFFSILVDVVPALVGVFWGAPLVARELESGTWRLAWTQSVTRARWYWAKVAVVGLAGMAIAGAVSLLVTWWATPADRIADAPYWTFDQRDIVPVAYGAFAFTLGVALGALIRRTVPAMAATLAVFVGARYAVTAWIRPHLLSPKVLRIPFNPFSNSNSRPSAAEQAVARGLIMSNDIVSATGKLLGPDSGIAVRRGPNGVTVVVGVGQCPNHFPIQHDSAAQHAAATCVASFHLRQVVTFQPASHYWPLQWLEAGIYAVLAAGAAGLAIWWVRRRVA